MNYIELINNFWRLNKEHSFTSNETQVYFKLLDTCNSLGWKNPFNQSNLFICAECGMSEPTLIRVRNSLKQLGLIDFISGKIKRQFTNYTILGLNDLSLSSTQSVTLSSTLSSTLSVEKSLDNIKQEKLNKTKLKREVDKNPEPESDVFDKFKNNTNLDLLDCFNQVISNQMYLETIAMNNKLGSIEKSIEWVNIFLKQLQNEGVEEKSISDFKSHFGRWLPIQIKRENGEKRNNIQNFRGHGQSGGKLIPVGGNSESSKDYTTV